MLESPFALCSSATPELSLSVSDVNLHKVFRISNIERGEEEKHTGYLEVLATFERSSVLSSLAITHDNRHLLVGDSADNVSGVHVRDVADGRLIRTILEIPGPTGIAVSEAGDVLVVLERNIPFVSLRKLSL